MLWTYRLIQLLTTQLPDQPVTWVQVLEIVSPLIALIGVIVAISVAWGKFVQKVEDLEKSFKQEKSFIEEWRNKYDQAAEERHRLFNEQAKLQYGQLEIQKNFNIRQDKFDEYIRNHNEWTMKKSADIATLLESVKSLTNTVQSHERRLERLESKRR